MGYLRAQIAWGGIPVGEGRHGEGFAEFVENKAFVVEEEGEGGGAGGDLSAEPQERRREVQLPPPLYFCSEVQRAAALVFLRETRAILVQHVEIKRSKTRRKRREDKLALFRAAAALARVEGFAARIGRCACARRHCDGMGGLLERVSACSLRLLSSARVELKWRRKE